MIELEIRDSRLTQLVEPTAELERLATGFAFTEGPAWHPYDNYLVFSDIIGNALYRWDQAGGVSIFRRPSYMANGNTFDRQGRLLTCEHGTSRVTRQNDDGSVEILASHYQGQELNSPNDIIVRSNGDIYFTDPNSGRGPGFGIPRRQELPFQGVYRLRPDGALTALIEDLPKPNGLCFSLDEGRLFVNDSDRQKIYAYEVGPEGRLAGTGSETVTPALSESPPAGGEAGLFSPRRGELEGGNQVIPGIAGSESKLWAELVGEGVGVADGMKFDRAGNLYCCGAGGIHLFDAEAAYLGRIRMPEQTANLAWGDDDLCSLYITATTSLYRLRVKVPGLKLF